MNNSEKQKYGENLKEKGKNNNDIGIGIGSVGLGSILLKEYIPLTISLAIILLGVGFIAIGTVQKIRGNKILREIKEEKV